MEKRMTSGEMARKAGVSQKAIRLYDEKGLLKPTDYSDGNYRLYDQAALQILEKIVALKQIGFSLEEIRDNLRDGEAKDIEAALRIQLEKMEEKRYQLYKVISAIERTLDRKEEKLDWDDVASIVQSIHLDQGADERYWDAQKHTVQEIDWYEKIYQSLGIDKPMKVLDLGCGYGNLWKKNWTRIPEGTKVTGYDVHGSWADDFKEYVDENKATLPEGVEISFEFENLEEEPAWEKIDKDKDYDLIIANYIDYQLHDPERFVERASKVLSKDGLFCFSGTAVSYWHTFYKEALEAAGVDASFLDEIIEEKTKARNERIAMLERHFGRVEPALLPNTWRYEEAEEILKKMVMIYPEQEKFITKNHDRIKSYFDKKIDEEGAVVLEIQSQFWHCYK